MLKYSFIFLLFVFVFNSTGFSQTDCPELFDAVESKDERKVFDLLNKGCNADIETNEGVTPLMYAAETGSLYITKQLVKFGADVNKVPWNKTTALIAATKANNIEVIQFLLENKANVHQKDFDENTPVIYTAAYGYPLACSMLCDYGAYKYSKNESKNPLLVAAYYGDNDIIDLVLKYDTLVDTKNFFDYTPLMVAAQEGHLHTVKLLVENGAEVKAENYQSMTALDFAVKKGHKDIVEYLLSEGAENHQISKTVTTRRLAKAYNQKEIYKLLKKKGKHKLSIGDKSFSFKNRFNAYDYMMGLEYAFHEPFYLFSIDFGFQSRPFRRKVLISTSENVFYQYREQRNDLYAGLKKQFNLMAFSKTRIGIFVGFDELYSFGSYKGSNKVFSEFIPSPNAGLYFRGRKTGISFSYEYTPYKVYDVYPHYYGFLFLFFFGEKASELNDLKFEF